MSANPSSEAEASVRSKPRVRFQGLRKFLAAIGGIFDGLFSYPFIVSKELGKASDHSTFFFIVATIASVFLEPSESIPQYKKTWIAKEQAAIDAEQKILDEEPMWPWGFKGYLNYFSGLLLGIISIPGAIIERVFNTPRKETFLAMLLKTPGRLLAALFISPFEMAYERANRSVQEREELGDFPEEIKRQQAHYQLSGLSDYLQVTLGILAGFVYGIWQALPNAINTVMNPPKDESFLSSALWLLPRLLGALIESPFSEAQNWAEEALNELDSIKTKPSKELTPPHRKLSGLEFLYIAAVAIKGFLIGALGALSQALSDTFFDPTIVEPAKNEDGTEGPKPLNETFWSKLYLSTYRFLKTLFLQPFIEANKRVNETRSLLDEQEPLVLFSASKRKPSKHPLAVIHYKSVSFGNYLMAALKGLAALLLSPILSPCVAALDFFGLTLEKNKQGRSEIVENAEPVSESLYSSLLFSPFRFLYVMLEDTYQRICSWSDIPREPEYMDADSEKTQLRFLAHNPIQQALAGAPTGRRHSVMVNPNSMPNQPTSTRSASASSSPDIISFLQVHGLHNTQELANQVNERRLATQEKIGRVRTQKHVI